jgi:hypothetical protein
MSGDAARPAVAIGRVYAEPADEHAPGCRGGSTAPVGEVPWLALWETGDVTRHASALELLRAVRRRDRRAADRAERLGRAVLRATVITWNHIPPGFVPPTAEDV